MQFWQFSYLVHSFVLWRVAIFNFYELKSNAHIQILNPYSVITELLQEDSVLGVEM
jgi:hypothetical protein